MVSEAISNSLDRYRIRKLEGRRLLLLVGETKILLIKDQELLIGKKGIIKRIFKFKIKLRDTCLQQLNTCMESKINN